MNDVMNENRSKIINELWRYHGHLSFRQFYLYPFISTFPQVPNKLCGFDTKIDSIFLVEILTNHSSTPERRKADKSCLCCEDIEKFTRINYLVSSPVEERFTKMGIKPSRIVDSRGEGLNAAKSGQAWMIFHETFNQYSRR